MTDTVKKVSALTAAGHGEASRRSRRYEGGLLVVTFRVPVRRRCHRPVLLFSKARMVNGIGVTLRNGRS